jgi:hypothetical protein
MEKQQKTASQNTINPEEAGPPGAPGFSKQKDFFFS